MSEFVNLFIYDTLFWFGLFGLGANILIWTLLYKRERRLRQSENRFHSKAESILRAAGLKSLDIIDKAEGDAGKIISQTEFIDNNVQADLAKSFRQLFTTNETKLSKDLSDIRSQMSQSAKDSMSQLLVKNEQSISSYVDDLKKETLSYHKAALAEVEDYKKKRLAEVENNLPQLLLQISKEFFSQGLALPDKEKLVFESLERAKKEGVFSSSVDGKTVQQ